MQVTISCKMADELAAQMDATAADRGVSRSEFIRHAIHAKLSRRKYPTKEEFLRYAGIVKGRPRHASTIEGFGNV